MALAMMAHAMRRVCMLSSMPKTAATDAPMPGLSPKTPRNVGSAKLMPSSITSTAASTTDCGIDNSRTRSDRSAMFPLIQPVSGNLVSPAGNAQNVILFVAKASLRLVAFRNASGYRTATAASTRFPEVATVAPRRACASRSTVYPGWNSASITTGERSALVINTSGCQRRFSANTCVFSVTIDHGGITADRESPSAAFTVGSVLRGMRVRQTLISMRIDYWRSRHLNSRYQTRRTVSAQCQPMVAHRGCMITV